MNIIFLIVFWAMAIAQLMAGFEGIQLELGTGWAWSAVSLAVFLRFSLPITIGAFFGATKVWGWHWALALVFVAPGLVFSAAFFLIHLGYLSWPKMSVWLFGENKKAAKPNSEIKTNNINLWDKVASVGKFAVILVVVSAIGLAVKVMMQDNARKSQKNKIKDALMQEFNIRAQQVNSQAPIMINKSLRLDRVSTGPGARMTVFYTLPEHSSGLFDKNKFLVQTKQEIVMKMCSGSETKKMLDYGGVMEYSYAGSDGVLIAKFEVKKKDCGLY